MKIKTILMITQFFVIHNLSISQPCTNSGSLAGLTETPDCTVNYILVFEDNFDGTSLDMSKWELQTQMQETQNTQNGQEYNTQIEYNQLGDTIDNKFSSNDHKNKKLLFSIEPFVYIPYYFVFSNEEIYGERTMYFNSWNIGLGSLLSMYVGSLKVSVGTGFNTKNYYRGNYSNNTIVDKISYRNFVIQANYKPFSRFSPFFAFVTKRPLHYNNKDNIPFQRELRDTMKLPQTIDILVHCTVAPWGWYWKPIENIPGIHLIKKINAIRMGVNYNENIHRRFNTNIQLFVDYAFGQDTYFNGVTAVSICNFKIGFSLNFELYLNKNYKNFINN